jgi:hypothetical protein
MTTTITTPAAHDIDTLGALLAQIETLTTRANVIKDAIKNDASLGGDKVVDGELFRATYSESNRSIVNTKKMYADLGITPAQTAKYTTTTAVYTVKVTSR